MKKMDILRGISKKTNFTIENCEIAYDALIEVLSEAMLADEEKILMSNFGTFIRKRRAPRTCRHIQTKEVMHVPESVTYTFKISNNLRQEINNK